MLTRCAFLSANSKRVLQSLLYEYIVPKWTIERSISPHMYMKMIAFCAQEAVGQNIKEVTLAPSCTTLPDGPTATDLVTR
jgi:hypothetical protein